MRRDLWRGVLTITATYVAFLLFAQFGFLSQAQRDLGDATRVRDVMAAMGIGGLAASLATAWLLGRRLFQEKAGLRLIRIGLAAVAAVAVASIACHSLPSLLAAAAGIGASLGLLTVAVAASLPEIVPPRRAGLAAGLATGAAYLVSNLPVLFEGTPAARALFPAGLAVVALLFSPLGRPDAPLQQESRWADLPSFVRLLVTFLVLIWLDSAAFAIVQENPELKAHTWGSAGQKLLQGGVHFVAAAGAGALLDAGLALAVPLAAWVLFAVAFPLLQEGGGTAHVADAAGPLYAIGISFYSTALVVIPTWRARHAVPPPRWRAGLLYGIAGWIGSALGVGMAQDQGRIPSWFLIATGAALALTWAPHPLALSPIPSHPTGRGGNRLFTPALALGLLGILGVGYEAARSSAADLALGDTPAAAVIRGRQVYIQEGCIHCHSQYVRPGTHDVSWWGPARPLDRSERPLLVGARRQGPDLLEVGNRRSDVWHEIHLRNPRRLNPGSRMPSYEHLFAGDGRRGRDLVVYLASLGADTSAARRDLTQAEPIVPPPAPPSRLRGAQLFSTYCAGCHGTAGRGDGPLAAKVGDPYLDLHRYGFHSLRRGPGTEPEAQALARILRHGLPPTSMPGHEWLTDQQVADLVAFVQTLPAQKESR